jgi:hypothetical protein
MEALLRSAPPIGVCAGSFYLLFRCNMVISPLTGVSTCGVSHMINPNTLKFEMGFWGPKGTEYHRDPIISAVYSHPAWVRWVAHFFDAPNLHTPPLLDFENQAFF